MFFPFFFFSFLHFPLLPLFIRLSSFSLFFSTILFARLFRYFSALMAVRAGIPSLYIRPFCSKVRFKITILLDSEKVSRPRINRVPSLHLVSLKASGQSNFLVSFLKS